MIDMHVVFHSGELSARVEECGDGSYSVYWTDHVANEWTETYPSLSVALLRFALLARIAEGGPDAFETSEANFPAVAETFISEQLF